MRSYTTVVDDNLRVYGKLLLQSPSLFPLSRAKDGEEMRRDSLSFQHSLCQSGNKRGHCGKSCPALLTCHQLQQHMGESRRQFLVYLNTATLGLLYIPTFVTDHLDKHTPQTPLYCFKCKHFFIMQYFALMLAYL